MSFFRAFRVNEALPITRPPASDLPINWSLGRVPRWACLAICFCMIHVADVSAVRPQSPAADQLQIEFGFAGEMRIGYWQPFVVVHPDHIQPTRFEIKVLDGDETPIIYAGPLHLIGSKLNRQQGYLKLGRGFGVAELKLFDRDDAEVASQQFTITRSIAQPSTRPFVLTLESTGALSQIISSTRFGEKEEQQKVVKRLDRPSEQLPVQDFCFQGVESVFISSREAQWISTVSQNQWSGLERWVRNGGQLIFSFAPEQAELFTEGGTLSRFFQGNVLGTATLTSSSRLDSIAASSPLVPDQLKTLAVAKIEVPTGKIEINQDEIPLVVRVPFGLGEIVVVTFDLEDPAVVEWAGYKSLVYQLQHHLSLQEAAQNQRASSRGGGLSHAGYEDLVGQLRVALDQFRQVQFLPFSVIALLIGLYILCIGPGDYFLLRRLTTKMELTWITFPMITLAFCGLAIVIARQTRPQKIQVNQLEIIDIDSVSGHVRGTVWSNLYSPLGGELAISMQANADFGVEVATDLLSWQGLPGTGYGGMQTKSSTGFFQQGYFHQPVAEQGVGERSKLVGMPVFVSSSKSLLTQYQGKFANRIQASLRLRSRASRLEGTITNPFDFPLDKCRIFFEGNVYLLDDVFEAGETIAVESETKGRTLVSLLTRRRRSAEDVSKFENIPWDENEKRLPRIADMLMFYKAVGGSAYTSGLEHDYQNFIDMSDHLSLGRAMLVAELPRSVASLAVDDNATEVDLDQVETIVRILLPVTYLESQR